MLKKCYCPLGIALIPASGLVLASCANSGRPVGGNALNNGANSTKVAFPKCGLDGAH